MSEVFSGFKKKIGKDTYIILILSGILLFIIALPTQKNTETEQSPKGISTVKTKEIIADTDKSAVSEAAVKENDAAETNSVAAYTQHLEQKLEKILSQMDGVGSVKVMLTVKSSQEQVVEKDIPNTRAIVSEEDAEGGNRSSNDLRNEESTVYITDASGSQIPYVVKKLEPDIAGVMVVAQGGGNAVVNKNITEVIEALFGMEAHKIKVVKMK